jgi:hypothetical protein
VLDLQSAHRISLNKKIADVGSGAQPLTSESRDYPQCISKRENAKKED